MLAIFNYLSPCREFYHNKHIFGKFARYIFKLKKFEKF